MVAGGIGLTLAALHPGTRAAASEGLRSGYNRLSTGSQNAFNGIRTRLFPRAITPGVAKGAAEDQIKKAGSAKGFVEGQTKEGTAKLGQGLDKIQQSVKAKGIVEQQVKKGGS